MESPSEAEQGDPPCQVRFDLIREQERAAAFEQFAEWIASYPGCPYGASARALIQKWAKPEGSS